MFGIEAVNIKFTLDNIEYEKTLVNQNYFYENSYNKKVMHIRKNVRTGARKQVFKGNNKEFTYSIFNITTQEWEDFYSRLVKLNNIEIKPHSDNLNFLPCFVDNIEFTLYSNDVGKVDFKFKTNIYKTFANDAWILRYGNWDNSGVWKNDGQWRFISLFE